MTPQELLIRELSIRGDLLDLIDQALKRGTEQERADLLAAAAIRIRAMNAEHDALCTDRAAEKARADALVEVGDIPKTPL